MGHVGAGMVDESDEILMQFMFQWLSSRKKYIRLTIFPNLLSLSSLMFL